jgi:hypothetical protein
MRRFGRDVENRKQLRDEPGREGANEALADSTERMRSAAQAQARNRG